MVENLIHESFFKSVSATWQLKEESLQQSISEFVTLTNIIKLFFGVCTVTGHPPPTQPCMRVADSYTFTNTVHDQVFNLWLPAEWEMVCWGFIWGFFYHGWGWPSFHTYERLLVFLFCGQLVFKFAWAVCYLFLHLNLNPRRTKAMLDSYCRTPSSRTHLAQSWGIARTTTRLAKSSAGNWTHFAWSSMYCQTQDTRWFMLNIPFISHCLCMHRFPISAHDKTMALKITRSINLHVTWLRNREKCIWAKDE